MNKMKTILTTRRFVALFATSVLFMCACSTPEDPNAKKSIVDYFIDVVCEEISKAYGEAEKIAKPDEGANLFREQLENYKKKFSFQEGGRTWGSFDNKPDDMTDIETNTGSSTYSAKGNKKEAVRKLIKANPENYEESFKKNPYNAENKVIHQVDLIVKKIKDDKPSIKIFEEKIRRPLTDLAASFRAHVVSKNSNS